MDVLADLVERSRARGSLYARGVFAAPWAFRFDPEPSLRFHAVLDGTCWLRRDGVEPLPLRAGDIALVAVEAEYELGDAPGTPSRPFAPYRDAVRRDGVFTWPGDGARTTLLCGAYQCEAELPAPLLRRLPDVVHLPARGEARRSLRATIDALAAEAGGARPGGQVVVDRLLDILLVEVLRAWSADGHAEAAVGSLGRPRDPEIARALERIHERPGAPWSLDALARDAGLSRSAFARRFSAAVGEPPMAYVTRWRMTLAAELLRGGATPLTAVAARVGYESVFAFSAAFKRVTGQAPSHYRSRLRDRERRGVAASPPARSGSPRA